MESYCCPVCNGEDIILFVQLSEYSYYECNKCNLIFISPDLLESMDQGKSLIKYNSGYWREELNAARERSSYFNFFLFFPVAGFRIISSWIKGKNTNKPARSDNSKLINGFISKILYHIFRRETYFLKKGVTFPTGISLMVISRKNN